MTILAVLVPNFLLVLLGIGMRRWLGFGETFWDQLERLVYYILFPALLFLAVARSGPHRDSRVVVIGDSDFVANYIGNIPGNVDLLLRTARWLARRDPRPPEPLNDREVRGVEITAGRERLIRWTSAAIPVLVALAGAVVWRRRSGRAC